MNVRKYLPSLTQPKKETLMAIVKGQHDEYKALEIDKLVGSAALDILLSLHDAFAFLDDFNARDSRFMRATLSANTTDKIRKEVKDDQTFSVTISNAKIRYQVIRTNDISTTCRDTVLRMTISLLVI